MFRCGLEHVWAWHAVRSLEVHLLEREHPFGSIKARFPVSFTTPFWSPCRQSPVLSPFLYVYTNRNSFQTVQFCYYSQVAFLCFVPFTLHSPVYSWMRLTTSSSITFVRIYKQPESIYCLLTARNNAIQN